MKLNLSTSVGQLRMIGPAYQNRLRKLGIETVHNLLYHKPFRYEDYSRIVKISSLQNQQKVTIRGTVIECRNIYTRSKKNIQKLILNDESGEIQATWFNQPFIPKNIKIGSLLMLSGMVQKKGYQLQLVSPEYEILKNGQLPIHTGRLVPIYPETANLSSKWLRSRISPLLHMMLPQINDWLPREIISKESLISLKKAIFKLHFPDSIAESKQALHRLAFDEMLIMQLRSQLRRKIWKEHKLTKKIKISSNKLNHFTEQLPFKLTSAQLCCLQEIISDLRKDKPMNRLLLGDVGSGKTVVAAAAIYASFLSHRKSVLMAPTEILVFQHAKTLKKLLEPFGVKIAIYTGSLKKDFATFDLIIGTHALIYKSLSTSDYGLIVIDEQHRFGVEQRAKLIQKGNSPHILTLSATPIPRTVALTLYGDLDLSLIDELPPGRIQVKTWVVPPEKRKAAYQWIKKRIKDGEQIFIVCPLIELSTHESMRQVKAATEEFEFLKVKVFKEFYCALLHGRLKPKEKEKIIRSFSKGKTDILITTPVVEVGIDIKNATVMMIEAAERFGLAQLHQLRGRVGRSYKQSYCLLFSSLSKTSVNQRLKVLQTSKSGFELAEMDLKFRGPGEIYGTQQHGFIDLKFASFTDSQLIAVTHQYAKQIMDKRISYEKNIYLKAIISSLEKPIEPN